MQNENCKLENERPVKLKTSWADLLGTTPEVFSPAERKARWAAWLQLAMNEDPECAEYWMDADGCEGCLFHEPEINWCRNMELPASVNPYLTIHGGMIGMACMGAGRTLPDVQLMLPI